MATKKKLDFSKMIFDVSKVEQDGDVLETFPRLKVYKEIDAYKEKNVFYEFVGPQKLIGSDPGMPSIDKVLIFIFLLYDVNSPYQELKSLSERKDVCLEEAGFKRDKLGSWPDNVSSLIDHKDIKDLTRMFLFRIQNHRKFNLYVSMERALEDTIENIGSPIIEQESQKKESAWKTRFGNCDGAYELLLKVETLEKDIFQEKEEIKELVSTSDKQESNFKAGMAERMADKHASLK